MSKFTESIVEEAALVWLESLSYVVKHGSDIAPDELRLNDAKRAAVGSVT